MNDIAIRVGNLSKFYCIGACQHRPGTLSDALAGFLPLPDIDLPASPPMVSYVSRNFSLMAGNGTGHDGRSDRRLLDPIRAASLSVCLVGDPWFGARNTTAALRRGYPGHARRLACSQYDLIGLDAGPSVGLAHDAVDSFAGA